MKKALQILLTLVIPALAQAQFFAPETIINSNPTPGNGFLCDVDGDGDEDVVQSDLFIPKRHRIYYRNGTDFDDVYFTSTLEPSNSSFSTLKGFADFDSDGDPDFYNGYGWMENVNGAISAWHFFHVDHHYSEGTASGDFNNDGHIDVVMSNCRHGVTDNGYHLMVMLNNGSGEFVESTNFVENPTGVGVSDVDENGTLDLIYYSTTSDTWYYYSGNGDGTFATVSTLISGVSGTTILADLNGDGLSDVLDVVNTMPADGTASLYIHYGQTGLGFENPVSFMVNSFQTIWYDNATNLLADYDGDGDLDIMLKPNRNVSWIENDEGNYIDRGSVILRQDQARTLLWTDINGDGRMDGLETGDHLITCVQDEDAKLYPRYISGEGGIYAGSTFMMIDENNDGVDDMLSFHGSGALVINSMNEFNYVSSHVVGFGNSEHLLAHLDYNRDGMKDIIQRDFYGMNCYERVADYTYKAPETIFSDLVGTAFAATSYDVDQDGSEDILVAVSNGQYQVYWYKYNESTGWQSQGLFANIGVTGIGPHRLYPFNVGDFNGDGMEDISLVTSKSCTLFIQLGAGDFDVQYIYTAPDANDLLLMGDHAVADFNLDGRDDVMFLQKNMNTSLKKFFIARYNGTAYEAVLAHQFTFDELTNSYPAPVWVASDFDADGDVDIMYSANDQIKRSMNNVIGFSSSQFLNITAAGAISCINVADIDGDVMPDLIFSGTSGASGAFVQSSINNLDSPYQIQMSAFIDYDGDAILNGFDEPLINQQIALSGDWGYAWTDSLGQFTFYGVEGPLTATMTINDEIWLPVTPLIQTANLTEANPTATMVFAITPSGTVNDVQGSILTMADVCGSDYGHWINVYNGGNTIASGTVTYTLADGFTYTWGSPEPASVDGQIITWNYEDLDFNQSITYTITAASPGVESIGTTVSHELVVTTLDELGVVLSTSTDDNTYIIECAYDPNDITENFGWSMPGYIVEEGLLEYTVRFQNLGNAPATDIRVENILSEKHNPGTVVPIASSHNYTIDQDAEGRLNFFFENINLPAAEDDEPASHGFITFRIRSIEGMNPGEQVHHHAAIYFDLNPPIFTNTATNTILDCESLEIIVPEGICSANDVQVESSRDEFVDYIWSSGLNLLGNGMNNTISFENSGVQNLKLEVSNPVCTIETEMTVEVLASPAFEEGVTEMTYCGEPVIIQAMGNGDINWSLLEEPLSTGNELEVVGPGVYVASLSNACGSAIREVNITNGTAPVLLNVSPDQNICASPIEVMAEGVGTIAWYQDDNLIGINSQLEITEAGTYRVEATTECGSTEQTISISQGLIPAFSTVSESVILCDATTTLIASGNGSIHWAIDSEIVSSSENLEVSEAGVYEAVVTTECGSESTEVLVNLGTVAAFTSISENELLCGEPLLLNAEGNGSITWFLESTPIGNDGMIEVSQAGIYRAVITASCGAAEEEVIVESGLLPEITSISEDAFLCGESMVISAIANSDIQWFIEDELLATQSEISISDAGTYRIEVQTNCGMLTDEVVISLGETPALSSISNDVVYCGTPVTLNAIGNGELTWFSQEEQIGFGNQIEITHAGNFNVQVQTACGIAEEEVIVETGLLPEITSISEDAFLCEESMIISAVANSDIQWFIGDELLTTQSEISISDAGTYRIEVQTNCGTVTDEVVISLGETPALSSISNDVVYCGTPITLNAIGNGELTWFSQEEQIGFGNQIEVNDEGTYIVQVQTECGTTEGEIIVPSGSIPEFTQLSESVFLCDGTATLFATGQGEISWIQGDVILSSNEEIEVSEPGIYNVVLSNICGLNSANVEVLSAPIPAFVETPTDMESCGENIVVNVSGTENESVIWYSNDMIIAEGNEYTVFSSAEFTIQLDNGCAVNSTTVNYTIHELPTVTLEWDPLNEVVIATEGFVSYIWTDNGTLVTDVVGNTFAPQSTLVEVEVNDINGCSDTESIIISATEEVLQTSFLIYPNPAVDVVHVTIPSSNNATSIDIIDRLGKVVHSQNINSTRLEVIQVNKLAAGIYTVRCGNTNQKLIIK